MIKEEKTINTSPEKINPQNINFPVIAKLIWAERKFIYKYLVLFFLIGLFIALFSAVEYKCEVSILPEIDNTKNAAGGLLKQIGAIGNIIGMGQFDLNSSTDAVRPDIYPDILSSKPFLIYLMNYKVNCQKNDSLISLYSYFLNYKPLSLIEILKKYSIGLPGLIVDKFKGNNIKTGFSNNYNDSIIRLTYKQEKFITSLKDRITTTFNADNGIISIEVIMPESKLSSEIAYVTSRYLTDYVRDYRIEKSQKQLQFVEQRLNIAKNEYIASQMTLAKFMDENSNMILASYKSKQDQLTNDFNIAFNVYNTLAQQYEQSKIKVEQEMPVIKLLNPPVEPTKKYKPQRLMILFFSIFIGLILSVSILIYKNSSFV